MAILKRPGGIILMGAAAAAVVGLSAAPAFAGVAKATYTVTPGGAITASAGTTTLTDTVTHNSLSCKTSKASATLKSGSGNSGTGLGSISALSFSTCTGPLGLKFTVKSSKFPWKLNATSYSGGVTKGTITGIHAKLTGPSCSATVAGSTVTAGGKVNVTYTNSTHALAVEPTGSAADTLHLYNVSGCAGLIGSGDQSQFVGNYTVSPSQTITSP